MSNGRFSRIEQMIGTAGLQRLSEAFVVVVGLGAVGSYVVEALTRSGVGRLRLVDFDTVHPSNLNRQLFALETTLGKPKVEVAKCRVLDIHPACQVEALPLFAHKETLDTLLAGSPNLVIDAIDSLAPKVALLAELQKRNIPAVSSMGAALRTDPSLVRVGPLHRVRNCPLARTVRQRLRKMGAGLDCLCVYSEEVVSAFPKEMVGEAGTGGDPDEFRRGRLRRPLGSLPTMVGIFGLIVANTALKMLLGDLFPGQEKGASF